MAPTAFRRGFRTFTVASILTAVVGVLHTLGLANDPPNDAWTAAIDAARDATLEAGPFSITFYGVYVGVWIQVGVLLVMLGLKNLIIVSQAEAHTGARLVRTMAAVDCAWFAALTALFIYFQIPPPLISFALLTVLFAVAAMLAPRKPPASGPVGDS